MAYTTIDDPELYFQVKAYTGNGSTSHAITLDGSENMQPDMIWIKCRSAAENHSLSDSVRGDSGAASGFYNLTPNTNDAEYGGSGNEYVGAIGSDGFTVGSNDVVNTNTETYVAWCWKESADAGFDIVSYTGNATARTISHSLSAVPNVIIVKKRSDSGDWKSQWSVLGNGKSMRLDSNEAVATASTYWNDTSPTSSVFSVGTDSDINGSSETTIAYLWSEKQGYSKFGRFVSNGQVDGNFVWTGFRPALVIIKRNAARDWVMHDNKRDGYNGSNENLHPNLNNAEGSGENFIDLLSNGFKIRSDDGTVASGGDDMMYMAFAEAPFVNSKGVPCNAR